MVKKNIPQAHAAEREQFLAQITALYSGSRAIANALSERQIFEAIFEQLCLEQPAEILAFRFDLVHDEPIWANVRVTWSERDKPTYPLGTRLYLPDTPHSHLLTTPEPLFIEDVATDSRISAVERNYLAPTGAASIVVLPLTFISHELGAIIIYFTQPRTFSEVTCRFWLALAEQAGLALNNRHLIQDAAYRAIQMETAAEVTRAASSLIELKSLLNSAAALIQDRFEFYYVGIFLVDHDHEWAELRAGTGEAGRLLLEDAYRLKVDDDSMIGWSIQHRKPGIALDVGQEAVNFQYPHLPKTRSEMALPLIYRNQVIGAVSVQSEERAAFSQTDVIFLQTMADQLANAIENSRLYEQVQAELLERKRAEELLQHRIELEELIAVTSQYFINLAPDDIDKGIVRNLQSIGEFFKIDRSYVFQFYEGGTIMDNTHEWCAPGIESQIEALQDIAVENAPWWIETLNQFENVYIPHLPAAVPETYAKNEILQARDIQSRLVVPMVYGGMLVGFMGCDSIRTERIWSEEEIKFFKIMGEIIINALERQRAEQEILRRNKELATFNRVAIAITSTPDPHARFRKVTCEIIEIFNACHSGVALLTSDQQALTILAACSRDGEPDLEGHVIPMANNPSFARVIETGRPLVVPDVQTSPLTEAIHDLTQKIGIQCMMIVPVISRREVVGTLGIDFDVANRQFTPDEVRLADTIAGQIAGAIENAQLLEQTRAALAEQQRAEANLLKALERTESLYGISKAVATATEPQTMFETVLGEYLRLIDLPWGSVSMLDRAGKSSVRIMYADGQPVQRNIASPTTTNPLFQHLAKNPEPLTISDVFTHRLTRDNQIRNELQARSVLCLPIVLRGQVIGIISAGSTQKEYVFSPGDIETGQTVADQLAVWLDNRQLLAEAQYRSDRLQTAAEVSRAASSILDMGELINTSVNYIREQFNFYYVGLFLVDDAGQWAVLRAGTGQAGRIQLEGDHRLEIGSESMIGWSIANRRARIALNVGEEAVHFKNPNLPDTHSEMALPLISRDQVIGAITIQSTERAAFSDEDITLLQTMADQLANAIVNVRLFENAAQARKEAEARLQETVALQQLSQNLAGTLDVDAILDAFFEACTKEIGFEYIQFSLVDKYQNRVKAIAGVGVSESSLKRADYSLDSKDIMIDIVKTGRTEIITGWDDRFDKDNFEAEGHVEWVRIFTPITLRQENIGLVEAGFNKIVQATIQDAQLRLFRAFINQTALALDNAQRYEASQRTARREALIKEITTKVRASTDLDTILQTTVKEVGQAIASKRAYIHLTSEQKPASQPRGNGRSKSGVPAKGTGRGGKRA